MATADQIKALILSHFQEEDERFYSVSLQVAAHEAKQGHFSLANEIKSLIEKNRNKKEPIYISLSPELLGLVIFQEPKTSFSSMVISNELKSRIFRIIHEYKQQEKIKSYGLSNRRKILLIGPPGTGKTMTASVLANELSIPLFTIQVDQLVTKFLGETSAKLRLIFDLIRQESGVYLFDEFDAIGSKRSMENDVGEMRRVLNAFLQFIEQDNSNSLIIAATNNPDLLDRALFRRFDDILKYSLPNKEDCQLLIMNILGSFIPPNFYWKDILTISEGLSQADIDNACKDALKEIILSGIDKVSEKNIVESLEERKKPLT